MSESKPSKLEFYSPHGSSKSGKLKIVQISLWGQKWDSIHCCGEDCGTEFAMASKSILTK